MASRPWNYDGVLFGEYFWKYAETSGYYEDICKIKSSHAGAENYNALGTLICNAKHFNDFGNAVKGEKMRLCDYAEEIYNFFSTKCDKDILRENILCDLLLLVAGIFLCVHPTRFESKSILVNNKTLLFLLKEQVL